MNKYLKALNKVTKTWRANKVSNTWKTIGITVAAAGLLYYPALKLYQFLVKRIAMMRKPEGSPHRVKAFSPAYRGRHKIHPRHMHNGHDKGSES